MTTLLDFLNGMETELTTPGNVQDCVLRRSTRQRKESAACIAVAVLGVYVQIVQATRCSSRKRRTPGAQQRISFILSLPCVTFKALAGLVQRCRCSLSDAIGRRRYG